MPALLKPTNLISRVITTAETATTADAVAMLGRVESLTIYVVFTYGSGGTTCRVWVQTSLDGGATWMDIADVSATTSSITRAYHLTAAAVTAIATPGDGALAANTSVNGFLGPVFRTKVTSTGTYAGSTTLTVSVLPK